MINVLKKARKYADLRNAFLRSPHMAAMKEVGLYGALKRPLTKQRLIIYKSLCAVYKRDSQ